MADVYILRGYSGSGKSSLASYWLGTGDDEAVIVSRDSIRAMLTGNNRKQVLDQRGENLVTKIEETAVREALRKGQDVIVDDTNLRAKFARRWADIATQEGAAYRVIDVAVTAEQCIAQDAVRGELGVGEEVIRKQAEKFPMDRWPKIEASAKAQSFTPYVPDTSLPEAYGFDLDGTLAHFIDPECPLHGK